MVILEMAKQNKVASTNIMVCTFNWKQSAGYLGNKINVMGVHGHYHTTNMKLSNEVTEKWWDKLKDYIDEYNVHFLVGDFNMTLTQVVPRLKARGRKIYTCSWYLAAHGKGFWRVLFGHGLLRDVLHWRRRALRNAMGF